MKIKPLRDAKHGPPARRYRHFAMTWGGIVGGCLISASLAMAAETATRPPQAQQALERGFQMAQQSQWPLAIRYFRQAQSAMPTDGAILFNLALAHDKASGHELVAMAWYQAFLALEPDAKTAPQIHKRITDIEVAAEIQIQRLLTTAHQAAGQITNSAEAAPAFDRIARAEAESGDLAAAERTVARVGNAARSAWALAQIAAAYAHAGNLDRALSQAGAIKAVAAKSWALADISAAIAKRGDFARAVKTTEGIGLGFEKAWAVSRVAALQARAGDIAGARALIEGIANDKPGPRAIVLAALARKQSKTDLPWAADSAKSLLAEAVTAAGSIVNVGERAGVFSQIARAYAELGDTANAEEILTRMADGPNLYLGRHAVAKAEGAFAKAAAYYWSALAAKGEENAQINDIENLLRLVQGQATAQVAISLAQSAEERARFLRELRTVP